MKKQILVWGVAGLVVFALVAGIILILGPKESASNQPATSYNGVEIVPDLRKDSIPALTNPEYESGSNELSWLKDGDLVIGVNLNDDIRAYPVKIMSWHEIINDNIGGKNVLISYSPLCGTATLFSRDVNGKTLDFGNTGAIYESCSVFYDGQTNSYWWQVNGKSIRGPEIESQLEILPSLVTTWGKWKDANPGSRVLSVNTGHSRDYLTDPYADYYKVETSAFPVSVNDDRATAKETVVGIQVNGKFKAYSTQSAKGTVLTDLFEGKDIEVIGSADGNSAQVYFKEGNGRILAAQTTSFWFAWSTAHPETKLYK